MYLIRLHFRPTKSRLSHTLTLPRANTRVSKIHAGRRVSIHLYLLICKWTSSFKLLAIFSTFRIILASLCGITLRNVYCRAHWTFDEWRGGSRGEKNTFFTVKKEENITTIEFIHQRMKWGFSQTNTIQFWQAWPGFWIVLWQGVGTLITQPSSGIRETLLNIPCHDSRDIMNFHLFMVCFGCTQLDNYHDVFHLTWTFVPLLTISCYFLFFSEYSDSCL